MPELDAEDRALDCVHPVVKTDLGVVVALSLGVVAKCAHPGCERVIVGHDCAAFAAGAEVLPRIETEPGGPPEAANRSAAVSREVSLRRVFEERQAVLVGDFLQWAEVRRLAVEVNRQN